MCGERFIGGLTENREPRRLLDNVWGAGPTGSGAVKTCLEAGQWNFALRTVQIDYNSSIQPTFGYRRVFDKPSDWCLTSGICSDEFFRVPLLRYVDETNQWYSDLDTIYVRYISNDVHYGGNLAAWPGSFAEFVAEFMASKIIRRLTNSEDEESKSFARLKKKLTHAKSVAAMAGPTAFPARGAWGLARNRGGGRIRDGGSNGSLIG